MGEFTWKRAILSLNSKISSPPGTVLNDTSWKWAGLSEGQRLARVMLHLSSALSHSPSSVCSMELPAPPTKHTRIPANFT